MKFDLDKLNQHFMVDKELIKRIVSYANIKEDETVLEIGAGVGKLTKEIKTKNLVVVEKDARFIKSLKLKFKNLKIINEDILKLKLNNYDKIIGNLPYNITEPLFWKLLRSNFKLCVFTVPESFANNLINNETKLGFVSSYFYKVEIKEKIKKESFDPKPRTNSCVMTIKPIKNDSFIKDILLQYDKKLKKALRESFVLSNSLTKKQADEKILSLGLNNSVLEKRVRNLSYIELSRLKHIFG